MPDTERSGAAEPPDPAPLAPLAPGTTAPSATRAGRLAFYIQRMLAPAVLLPMAAVHVAAVELSLQALSGAPLVLTTRSAVAGLSVFLFSLLLRVQDELKDVATDRKLAAAGDPRYVGRPIVTGHVTEGDLWFLWRATLVLLLVVNAPLGFPLPFLAFLGTLALAWASLHWFFWPRIQTSLVLAFLTHNPLSLAVSAYIVAVVLPGLGPAGLGPYTVPLIVGLWMPVAAWETSRKVRLPEDETDYTTYSKVLGWRVAAIVPAGFVAVSVACLAVAGYTAGAAPWLPFVLAGAGAVPVGRCLLLRLAPTRARTDLRPATELYAGVAGLALVGALVAARGVTFAGPWS